MSSLLRDTWKPRTSEMITFHVRRFNTQTRSTRLCGFYAVAAAVSCCTGKDPTGTVYDENELANYVDTLLASTVTLSPFPHVTTKGKVNVQTVHKQMLYCICHMPSENEKMIECTNCGNWFHLKCVTVPQTPLKVKEATWNGPCCTVCAMYCLLLC